MAQPHELPGAAALPMLDVYLPMMRGAAVLAAARLGLFAQLVDGPRTVPQLARRLRCDAHGIERLADLLVAAGWLVRRRGGGYANSRHTQRWFTAAGAVDYTSGLSWTHDAWQLVASLDEAVAHGGPRTSLWQRMHQVPAMGQRFAAYMRAFAEHAGPSLYEHVHVPPGARTLLDIGGSHGLHSIALCRRHPQLRAVVFDHAASLQGTRANLRAHGLSDRITTRAGDCTKDALGTGFDVVLYFSVAHNQSAAANAKVLRRIARALRPGGVLVVHDYVRGVMPSAYNAAFDLTLLLEVGQRTHPLRAFRTWVEQAGLVGFRHRRLQPAAMGSVMTARQPGRLAGRR